MSAISAQTCSANLQAVVDRGRIKYKVQHCEVVKSRKYKMRNKKARIDICIEYDNRVKCE